MKPGETHRVAGRGQRLPAWMLDDRHRTWHDLAASTLVIHSR